MLTAVDLSELIPAAKNGVGLEISLRLCNALKVNRFELLVLACEDEYKEYVKMVAKQKEQ